MLPSVTYMTTLHSVSYSDILNEKAEPGEVRRLHREGMAELHFKFRSIILHNLCSYLTGCDAHSLALVLSLINSQAKLKGGKVMQQLIVIVMIIKAHVSLFEGQHSPPPTSLSKRAK